MMMARLAAMVGVCLVPVAAMAAPGCRISPIVGLLTPTGATATMQAASTGAPCGTRLWVQQGVIPFTVLRLTAQPEHGHVDVSDPTQFSYSANAGYRGTDSFQIMARGNSNGAGQVTGTLRVNVVVGR